MRISVMGTQIARPFTVQGTQIADLKDDKKVYMEVPENDVSPNVNSFDISPNTNCVTG